MRPESLLQKIKNIFVDMWYACIRYEQCDERLAAHGEVHYCQKRKGHDGKCKTCFGREFN